ncbi:MAG: hypothetical protein R2867_00740 [Caldilineaceae bacterium]
MASIAHKRPRPAALVVVALLFLLGGLAPFIGVPMYRPLVLAFLNWSLALACWQEKHWHARWRWR